MIEKIRNMKTCTRYDRLEGMKVTRLRHYKALSKASYTVPKEGVKQ